MNYYSPFGNFEDIFLLPIVYVILIPGVLSFLMASGFDKIYGLIFSAVPLYAIIYDLIYKIKLNKSHNGHVDDRNLVNSFFIFIGGIRVFFVGILCLILFFIFFSIDDSVSRVIFLPFLLCVVLIFHKLAYLYCMLYIELTM
jgi:hypothetical protein